MRLLMLYKIPISLPTLPGSPTALPHRRRTTARRNGCGRLNLASQKSAGTICFPCIFLIFCPLKLRLLGLMGALEMHVDGSA